MITIKPNTKVYSLYANPEGDEWYVKDWIFTGELRITKLTCQLLIVDSIGYECYIDYNHVFKSYKVAYREFKHMIEGFCNSKMF